MKGWQWSIIHPISPKTQTPQYQSTERMKRKAKQENTNRDNEQLWPVKIASALFLNPLVPHYQIQGQQDRSTELLREEWTPAVLQGSAARKR